MARKPQATKTPPQEQAPILERIKVEDLCNDPSNVRVHNPENIRAIKASLARFGQQKPIVIDGNSIVIAGNGTLEAARELGWTHLNATRSSLNSVEAIAYAIADNRTAELAEWDTKALLQQLEAIKFGDEELFAACGWMGDYDRLKPIVPELASESLGFNRSREEYEQDSIKQLVVLYERTIYTAVIAKLDAEMDRLGVTSHADVLLALLEIHR